MRQREEDVFGKLRIKGLSEAARSKAVELRMQVLEFLNNIFTEGSVGSISKRRFAQLNAWWFKLYTR